MAKRLLLLVILFLFFLSVNSQDRVVRLPETKTAWVHSNSVNDKYLLECYIPANAETPIESLPVIFLLDSDMTFGLSYDIIRWLRLGDEIAEVALVGISYKTGFDDWWKKRARDYTLSQDTSRLWGYWPLAGAGQNFVEFIEKELFTFVADEFGLKSEDRTIAGLAMGGLFCYHMLFTRPGLFRNYIIAGPTLKWSDLEIFELENAYAQENSSLKATVFTSVGSLDHKSNMLDPWYRFNNQIKARQYKGLNYKTEVIFDETHISMIPSALTKGIRYIYKR